MAVPEMPKGLDFSKIRTPAYVLDIQKLEENLRLLKKVENESGAAIILALKGFSMYGVFDTVNKYLRGTTSSGINEALLAKEYFGGEIHVYNPAFEKEEVKRLAAFADTIVFNSQKQIDKFADFARECAANAGNNKLEIGLRVNPEYAEVETEIYNPCARGSRLGALRSELRDDVADKIDMLHFHAMCEQGSDVLGRIIPHFEQKFGDIINKVKKVNFGGGHHITKPGYDTAALVRIVKDFYQKHPNIQKIYLEPGEAVALNTGVFATRVMETIKNGTDIAVLDCSATCHMPDVLEMPYRPQIFGAGVGGEKAHTYSLGGRSCLAGDRIGEYSFDNELREGDILVFGDMAHYTMVKTTTFNGVNLPDIAVWDGAKKEYKVLKTFGYDEFKSRL